MFLANLKPFLVFLLLFSSSIPLSAQEKEKKSISENNDKSNTSQPIEELKFDKESADLSEEQCPKIREGSSTIEKIAGLKGAMSVRNLTFKYFDKPLFSLTDYDYEHMKVLKSICDNSSEEIAGLIFDNLKEKVEEAKDTRDNTVNWIKNTSKRLKGLPLGGSSVRVIHNAWKEMENRSQEMLLTDLHYLANLLDSLLKKHYQKANTSETKFVSPFIPPNTEYKTRR
tara:strand:- start:220 stop:900 length:681 start_codon:yes stop_codon:yes gene_type:complete